MAARLLEQFGGLGGGTVVVAAGEGQRDAAVEGFDQARGIVERGRMRGHGLPGFGGRPAGAEGLLEQAHMAGQLQPPALAQHRAEQAVGAAPDVFEADGNALRRGRELAGHGRREVVGVERIHRAETADQERRGNDAQRALAPRIEVLADRHCARTSWKGGPPHTDRCPMLARSDSQPQ
jgi:hypothetical protein